MPIINGTNGDDNLFGDPSASNEIYGLGGNDTLTGGAGNDRIDGGAGNDTATFETAANGVNVSLAVSGQQNTGDGADTLVSIENLTGSRFNDVLIGNGGANWIYGSIGGDDQFFGGGGSDYLFGAPFGDNYLDGGSGADRMEGHAGNDTYVVDDPGDQLFDTGDEFGGTDTVRSSISFVLGADFENLTLTGTGAIDGTGNELSNSLVGNSAANVLTGGAGNDLLEGRDGADTIYAGIGDDRLIGGAGNDLLYGGGGDDWFVLGNGTDQVNGGGGYDTVDYSLASAGVVQDFGPEADTLYYVERIIGSSFDDELALIRDGRISGGEGNDRLYAIEGSALLEGGTGNDVYVIWGGGRVDSNGAAVRYMTPASATIVETADAGTDLVLSEVTYSLAANVENLELLTPHGSSANIDGTGNSLANIIRGNSGANRLSGAGGNDQLHGNAGSDTLDGGTGADTMRGGAGDDTYHVDNSGDLAIENADEGSDLVYSSVNYRLRDNVEDLTLTGTAVRGTGNSLGNRLVGNASNNILDGEAGADVMRGGLGDDTYHVEDSEDRVVENASEGTDSVISSISFALASNVENLTLTGTAIRATGNSLDNRLVGSDGDNVLNGGLGADIMRGGAGSDVYYVDNAGDIVVESSASGTDRVYSSVSLTLGGNVEQLFLRGSGSINATGNTLNNVLVGNSAANILDGGAEADDLRGGGGADTFLFDDGDFGGFGASVCDRIIDFSRAGGDLIDLSRADANSALSGDQGFAFIGTGAFTGSAGELRYQQAGGNTYVYGDTNGDGTADFMIRVDGLHSFVAGDFVL